MTTRWEVERAVRRSQLPAPARLIVFVLCSLSKAETAVVPREYGPSLSELATDTGLSRRSVATHLNTLESDGWVIRARPDVTAARVDKERTQYRLSIPAGAAPALASPNSDDMASAPDAPASAGDAPELVQLLHRASAGAAHKNLNRSEPAKPAARGTSTTAEQIVREATGCTPAEATTIAAHVRHERQPRSLPGLLRRMAVDGDLADLLADIRGAAQRDHVSAALAEARRGPQCIHGVPGGASPHPSGGEPICPQCRYTARIQRTA